MFARGDFSALVITCLLMLIPVLAFNNSLNITDIGATTWQVSLNQLIPVALASVIFGFLLARSHYSEVTALLLSWVYAVGTIVAVMFFSVPGDPLARVREIVLRFVTALNTGLSGADGLDPYLLILFLSVLVWFLGHNTAWHTFRIDRVWRAILPPAIVLVLNSFYNTGAGALDGYLILYLFLGLLLIVRSHIDAREFDWYANRVAFTATLRNWFFRAGAILGFVLLIGAWLIPSGNADDNSERFQQFLSSATVEQLVEVLNKLFSSLDAQSVATADYYGGDKLRLGGAIQLGDQVVMGVAVTPGPSALSAVRYYWKSRSFDTYTNGEWTAAPRERLTTEAGGLVLTYPDGDATARTSVTQRYAILVSTKLLYAAPQPTSLRLPVSIELERLGAGAVDPIIIRPATALRKGDGYEVESAVVVANAPFLRSTTAEAYPAWVMNRYLQIPTEVSTRVRDLAFQIAGQAGAVTPYDKAKAIERWLRDNITYDETPSNPPLGRELIDWTLFESREGYCTYYASAMVIMLRSMGIPARMAAGFAQGIWEDSQQLFLVRERDAHTWVEAYFPRVGWVEFEPTTAQQVLERPDPQVITPTPTPTLPPPPTPTPTEVPAQPDNPLSASTTPSPSPAPQDAITITPTPTETLLVTPTPTATPTATPLSPLTFLELPPEVATPLTSLLLIGALVALGSFALVGTLWWIEYRGLDRVSPIGRAYARLAIYARWMGITLNGAQTPLERGRRVAREVPPSTNPVMRITDTYIVERYSPPQTASVSDEAQAQQAWQKARREFIAAKIERWIPRWLRRKKKKG